MEITLIQPARPAVSAEERNKEHWALARPFSLLFLAASIKQRTNYKVAVVDFESSRENVSEALLESAFRDDISSVFGITATTYTRFEAIRIAKALKKLHPEAVVVLGGVHFMYWPEDTLRKVPEVDVIVRGEGELTVVELANAVERGSTLDTIHGITYRKRGQIVSNPDRAVFQDLDSLPLYKDFSPKDYPEYLFGYPEQVPAVSVISSRGCPYRCIFCSKAGMKYRVRNVKLVVDEIEFLKQTYSVECINFLDLTLTASPNHTRALCQEMIDRNLNVRWWCETRVNQPFPLLELMKRAGCVSLVAGVESGSPRILSRIRKDITPEQAVQFFQACKDLNIYCTAYLMFSHPDETAEDVKQTLDLIDKLRELDIPCAFQPTMVFPGTELEKIARQKGIIPADFSWCDPYESDLSREIGQFPNVPLFIDKLPIETMRRLPQILKRRDAIAQVEKKQISTQELMIEGFRAIRRFRFPLRYLSPKYLCRVAKLRFGHDLALGKAMVLAMNEQLWQDGLDSPVGYLKHHSQTQGPSAIGRLSAVSIHRALSSAPKYVLARLRWLPLELRLRFRGYSPCFKIFTHMTLPERLLLYKLVRELKQGSVIVEIGSYLGASSTFLAAGAKESRSLVYCVDTWENDAMSEGQRDTYEEFMKNTQRFKTVIAPLRGLSTDVARSFNKRIDLLFIDGDHSYEGVKEDVEAWFPKLNEKAVVIFHDIGWAEGVQKVVAECVRPSAGKEIFLPNLYAAFVGEKVVS